MGLNIFELNQSLPIGALCLAFWLISCSSDDTPNPPIPGASDPELQWQQSLGGTGSDEFPIIRSHGNGFVLAAATFSNDGDVSFNHNTDYADIWLVNLDASGNIVWEKSLGGSVNDSPQTLLSLSDGGYLIGGISNSLDGDVSGNNGSIDWWLVRLNANGDILWETNLGGSLHEGLQSIIQQDQEFLIAGTTASNDGDVSDKTGIDRDLWLVRVDGNGAIIEEKTYGKESMDEGAVGIFSTQDGGYMVIGDASGDVWILKLDSDLNINWEKFLGGSAPDELQAVISHQGGYTLAVTSESSDGDVSNNHGSSDIWLVQIDEDGDIKWERNFGGTDTELAASLALSGDGGFWLAGSSGSSDVDLDRNQGGLDYWVLKLDANGEIIWSKTYGGTSFDRVSSLIPFGSQGMLVAGNTNSADGDIVDPIGFDDLWLLMIE
jgi:hypothetical protein